MDCTVIVGHNDVPPSAPVEAVVPVVPILPLTVEGLRSWNAILIFNLKAVDDALAKAALVDKAAISALSLAALWILTQSHHLCLFFDVIDYVSDVVT
jgi:hypothetical protein